jgi:hypothetical protein
VKSTATPGTSSSAARSCVSISSEPSRSAGGFDEWLARLEGLLRWHRIQLVNGALWLVNMPESGSVHVTTAVPSNMSPLQNPRPS